MTWHYLSSIDFISNNFLMISFHNFFLCLTRSCSLSILVIYISYQFAVIYFFSLHYWYFNQWNNHDVRSGSYFACNVNIPTSRLSETPICITTQNSTEFRWKVRNLVILVTSCIPHLDLFRVFKCPVFCHITTTTLFFVFLSSLFRSPTEKPTLRVKKISRCRFLGSLPRYRRDYFHSTNSLVVLCRSLRSP